MSIDTILKLILILYLIIALVFWVICGLILTTSYCDIFDVAEKATSRYKKAFVGWILGAIMAMVWPIIIAYGIKFINED